MTPLEESYLHCERVARERAKNFYHSFRILPREKRRAMCAVYAFMRECDDLSDEPREGGVQASKAALNEWRHDLALALDGGAPSHPLWPAFAHTAKSFAIPPHIFHEMIDGVSSDLDPRRIETFDDLYRYCYLVASVAGLATIHIFGFHHPDAPALAEKCGIAFQLTNIIRDVAEDARNARVYLPASDMNRFGDTEADLLASRVSDPLRALLEFEARRAENYFAESRPLIAMVSQDSRGALWALIEIYRRLLQRIRAREFEVLSQRVRLSGVEKGLLAARALAGLYT
jgi:phytoene synthase